MPDDKKPLGIAGGSLAALVKMLMPSTISSAPKSQTAKGQLLGLLGDTFSTSLGGLLHPPDVPYLDQYTGAQRLRPTALRPQDAHIVGSTYQSTLPDEVVMQTFAGEQLGKWPTTPTKIHAPLLNASGASGLGRHHVSASTDAEGPFVSFYDVWDMDSQSGNVPAIGKIADKLLGTPFTVYDKFDVVNTAAPDRSGITQYKLRRRPQPSKDPK